MIWMFILVICQAGSFQCGIVRSTEPVPTKEVCEEQLSIAMSKFIEAEMGPGIYIGGDCLQMVPKT